MRWLLNIIRKNKEEPKQRPQTKGLDTRWIEDISFDATERIEDILTSLDLVSEPGFRVDDYKESEEM